MYEYSFTTGLNQNIHPKGGTVDQFMKTKKLNPAKANWKPLYEKQEAIWFIKNIALQQWELQITMDRIQYYTFDLVEVVDEVFPDFVIKKIDGNGWIDDVVHHLINTARIPYPIEELI